MNKNNFCFLLISFLLLSCQSSNKFWVGRYTWLINENNNDFINYVELKDNGKISYNINNYLLLDNAEYIVQKIDYTNCCFEVKIKDNDIGKLTFSSNDSLSFITTYKTYIDERLIDETMKVEPPQSIKHNFRCEDNTLSDIVLLNDSLMHHFIIIYDSKSNNKISNHIDTIYVNNKGFGFSKQIENSFSLFSSSRIFKFENSSKNINYLNKYQINNVSQLDPNSLVVVGMGYNQVGIDALRKKFNFEGNLNVEFFYVDIARNIKMSNIARYYKSLDK